MNLTAALQELDPDAVDKIYSRSEQIVTATVVYSLDFLLIVGNFLVIVAFLNDRQLRITRNYYIFNLAIADLIIGLVVVPIYSSTIWMNDWVLSRQLCVVWIIVNQTAVFNSHAALALITYDRYKLVKNAMNYTANESTQKAFRRIVTVWILSTIFNTVFVIFGEWYYSTQSDMTSCSPYTPVEVPYFVGLEIYDIIVTTGATMLMVFIPLITLIALNTKVYILVRKRVRRSSALSTLIHRSLPSAHVIANVNLVTNLPTTPAAPVISLAANDPFDMWQQVSVTNTEMDACPLTLVINYNLFRTDTPQTKYTISRSFSEQNSATEECRLDKSGSNIGDHSGRTRQGPASTESEGIVWSDCDCVTVTRSFGNHCCSTDSVSAGAP